MKAVLVVTAAASALALLVIGGASAATDPFVTACMAKPNAGARGCECQARLARASFSPQERNLAIVGLGGNGEGFRNGIAKLKKPQRDAFLGKMQALGRRAAAECN